MPGQAPKRKSTKKCPKCGNTFIAKIIWGEPILSQEVQEKLVKKELYIGGCVIPINEDGSYPKRYCNDCKYEW